MKRDLLAALVGVAAVACWASPGQPGAVAGFDQLQLTLSRHAPDPMWQSGDFLTLVIQGNGQGEACCHQEGVVRASPIHLTPEQMTHLAERLEQAGAWQLENGDSQQPEERVYYTRLLLRRGERKHLSLWRGLPETHRACANCLLEALFGAWLRTQLNLWQGLQSSSRIGPDAY